MESRTRTEQLALVGVRLLAVIGAAIALMLVTPGTSHALTLVAPADGAKLGWMHARPMVAFDVAQGEKPKWVLLATDAAMTKTVRYCRVFGAAWVGSSWHWGCDTWSTGTDAWGNDIIAPLDAGVTYYLRVTYTDKDDKEQVSEVRDFRIDPMPKMPDISDISDRIWGSIIGDGSNLNTGAAAYINSGLKVNSMRSLRVSTYRFSIGVGFSGNADLTRSYVKVISKAGVRYVPLRAGATGGEASANWRLTTAERRLKDRSYRYQAFIKSTKNGAMVRSPMRILVIKRS
jgi:hypothetical protein